MSYQQPIYLDPKMVPAELRGRYSGKHFKAVVTESVTIPADAGLWSGGSRDHWTAIHAESGNVIRVPYQDGAPWDNARADRTVSLTAGIIVVCHSIFCGKDMGLTFYIHPDNAAKLLPAPTGELSEHEQIVLNATCSYKASYNGRDRYDMARDDHCWGPGREHRIFMTRDKWEAAKQSLIEKKLLNKAGAVTVAGRNARVKP